MRTIPKRGLKLRSILRDERGVATVLLTVYLPVFCGLMALCADMSNAFWARNQLQVTAEAAALAASAQLPDTTPCSNGADTNSACAVGVQYAQKNMPLSRYGNILKGADVIAGTWASGCTGSASCFTPAAAGVTSCTSCNAVKVTTRRTKANGNPVPLYFAWLLPNLTKNGSIDVSATAIATYESGDGQAAWNVNIVEDISESFSTQIVNAKAADSALLNSCILQNAASGSLVGMTLFTGSGLKYQAPIPFDGNTKGVSNSKTLQNSINNFNACGSKGMPQCSGSNIAAGITAAVNAMTSTSGPPGGSQNLILVTDGQSNPTSLNAPTLTAAENAWSLDQVNISVIYYCANNSCSSGQAVADQNFLKTLVQGKGLFLPTPTSTQIAAAMLKICSTTMQHRLVW